MSFQRNTWKMWFHFWLTNRYFLWMLFIVNFAGTVYGYEWYWNQLQYTITFFPTWFAVFVPDSPTASLFFTLSLLYLLFPDKLSSSISPIRQAIRSFIEAFALITSFKYGIWAVAMIVSGSMLGDSVNWQDWMLMLSHSGMALEVLLFAMYYTYRWGAIVAVACWTLCNDFMDYGLGIYPWLPSQVDAHLSIVAFFTVGLSLLSIAIASRWAMRNQKRHTSR